MPKSMTRVMPYLTPKWLNIMEGSSLPCSVRARDWVNIQLYGVPMLYTRSHTLWGSGMEPGVNPSYFTLPLPASFRACTALAVSLSGISGSSLQW